MPPSLATMFGSPCWNTHGTFGASASRNSESAARLREVRVGVGEAHHVERALGYDGARPLDHPGGPDVGEDAAGRVDAHPGRFEIVDPATPPGVRPVAFEARRLRPEALVGVVLHAPQPRLECASPTARASHRAWHGSSSPEAGEGRAVALRPMDEFGTDEPLGDIRSHCPEPRLVAGRS